MRRTRTCGPWRWLAGPAGSVRGVPHEIAAAGLVSQSELALKRADSYHRRHWPTMWGPALWGRGAAAAVRGAEVHAANGDTRASASMRRGAPACLGQGGRSWSSSAFAAAACIAVRCACSQFYVHFRCASEGAL